MQARHNKVMMVLTGLLLLATACGGGGTVAEQNQEQGTVSGSLTVGGALLAELASGQNPGPLDPGKFGVRVIEPIIDIDAIEIETSGSSLNVTPVPPGTAKLLQLSLLPAEDLEGQGSATTPVLLNIPITVEEGALTNIAMQVQFEQGSAAASKAGSQLDRPWFVRLRYVISGSGATTRHLRIRWADRLVQYDTDLDDDFDEEDAFEDNDRDGLGNDFRELINDQAADRAIVTQNGVISAFNPDRHSLSLASGLEVRISEITLITLNGEEARPGMLSIGNRCIVRGYPDGDALLRALEIDASSGSDLSSRR